MRKAHFWGFPEILSHLEKDMDYQSGQAKKTNFIFWKIWESKFQNGTKNLQKASEMEFLDHVHVEQQSCCRECNESSKKSNQIENLWILPTFWLVCLITFMADTSLQGAGISRVSSDSWFSDNVDIFRKNPHRKILSFRKVMAIQKKCFFFPQLSAREFKISS